MDLKHIAHHEAGHAVAVAYSGTYQLSGVSIAPATGDVPRLDSAGRASVVPPIHPLDLLGSVDREAAETVLMIFLAGPAAGYVYSGQRKAEGYYLQELASHPGLFELVRAHAAGSPKEYLQWLQARARAEVEDHWPAVEQLANTLLEKTALPGEDARKIIHSAMLSDVR